MAVVFIRNAISTIFVFAQDPWTASVGLDWFFVTFGLIVTVVMICNVIFIYFGKTFRAKYAARYRSFVDEKHASGMDVFHVA